MSKSKAKGTRFENEIVEALQEFNSFRAGRIVGNPGDVEITIPFVEAFDPDAQEHFERRVRQAGQARKFLVECKRRARAWKDLYTWLEKNDTDFLAIRADRQKPLIVMDLDSFRALLKGRLPRSKKGNVHFLTVSGF